MARAVLEELRIRDIGVIEDVTLALEPGLNVVTGETGAGKTMVVSALQLLLGGRSDADRVRAGAATALVEGRLRPPPPGSDDWLDDGDDELVVAREVGGGRSRARLGGRMAPAGALAATVGAVVDVHGQYESVRFASGTVQRALLDAYGGAEVAAARDAYDVTYGTWCGARDELAALQASERERARELDRLAFEVAEIDRVAPQPGEDEDLAAEADRLEHAEGLRQAAAAAAAALTGEGGARDALGGAVAALRQVGGVDTLLDAHGARAQALLAEAQDLALELEAYGDALDDDPRRLEAVRQRRADLAALARKYGADSGDVVAYASTARARLDALRGGDERAAALAGDVTRLEAATTAAAAALTAERSAAGERLGAAVHGHLAELAMPDARLEVALEPREPGPHGADRVALRLAAAAGEPALPLAKAASGGERSRVALAVRLALADTDATPVLVFDEVDAGIGGATALVVGRKLAALARGRQVLCVTHLAQLAAFADAHFAVTKSTAGGRTRAEVALLDDGARVVELSRMLSGTPDSEAAAANASELLALARTGVLPAQ